MRAQDHHTSVDVLEKTNIGATMARPGDIITLSEPDLQPTTGASEDIAEPATTA